MERARNRGELAADSAKAIRHTSRRHRRKCGKVKGGRDELNTRLFGGRNDDGDIRLIKTGFGRVRARHD